jgi:hypothetical protein
MDNILNSVKKLSQLYDNVTYWDEYGTSVIIFIVLMIILFTIHSYFFVMMHLQPIKENWAKERCSAPVIPFAGLINKPLNKSILSYTEENFTYCMQGILSKVAGYALQPVTFLTHSIEGILTSIGGDIQDVRSMFNDVRNNVKSISEEIMGRLLNIMAPIQEVIIKMRDMFGKVQGVMTAGLYTMLGGYMTLQSLIGAIIQALIIILGIIAATIAILLIFPFTIPLAMIDIGIFTAIAIPTIILCVFANQMLQIQSPSFCFDKHTPFILKDGTFTTMENLKVGDILEQKETITAIIKVKRGNSKMYNLNNIIVSESHSVFYNNKWIKVNKHPNAIELTDYKEEILYCINTTSKNITLNNNVFCDWDELYDDKLNNCGVIPAFIHEFTDGGFSGKTLIRLKNGLKKKINEINIGDILENGECVNGVVQINGKDLSQYYYHFANITPIEGGNQLYYIKNKSFHSINNIVNKKEKVSKDLVLYHLITDTKTFYVNNIIFGDYNYCIDLLFS